MIDCVSFLLLLLKEMLIMLIKNMFIERKDLCLGPLHGFQFVLISPVVFKLGTRCLAEGAHDEVTHKMRRKEKG